MVCIVLAISSSHWNTKEINQSLKIGTSLLFLSLISKTQGETKGAYFMSYFQKTSEIMDLLKNDLKGLIFISPSFKKYSYGASASREYSLKLELF